MVHILMSQKNIVGIWGGGGIKKQKGTQNGGEGLDIDVTCLVFFPPATKPGIPAALSGTLTIDGDPAVPPSRQVPAP